VKTQIYLHNNTMKGFNYESSLIVINESTPER